MNFVSITEAATEKACTRAGIWGAIKRKALDGQKIGTMWAIRKNKKYEEWLPNPKTQAAGRMGRKVRSESSR